MNQNQSGIFHVEWKTIRGVEFLPLHLARSVFSKFCSCALSIWCLCIHYIVAAWGSSNVMWPRTIWPAASSSTHSYARAPPFPKICFYGGWKSIWHNLCTNVSQWCRAWCNGHVPSHPSKMFSSKAFNSILIWLSNSWNHGMVISNYLEERPLWTLTCLSAACINCILMWICMQVGMLFVRCTGGISHSPAEHVLDDDIWASSLALLRFMEGVLGDLSFLNMWKALLALVTADCSQQRVLCQDFSFHLKTSFMQKQLDFKLSKRLPKPPSFYWNSYAASVKDYKIKLGKLHLQAMVT
jgi:hypothetical protein